MRAVQLKAWQSDPVLADVPQPTAGPGQVVIKIAGAGLDVFLKEPPDLDHPLLQLDNVIVTPHSAGTTPLAAARAAQTFCQNLRLLTAGEPLTNVGFGPDIPTLRRR
mgnify:CR=1 FL=1